SMGDGDQLIGAPGAKASQALLVAAACDHSPRVEALLRKLHRKTARDARRAEDEDVCARFDLPRELQSEPCGKRSVGYGGRDRGIKVRQRNELRGVHGDALGEGSLRGSGGAVEELAIDL